jgi:hypothetical protein
MSFLVIKFSLMSTQKGPLILKLKLLKIQIVNILKQSNMYRIKL